MIKALWYKDKIFRVGEKFSMKTILKIERTMADTFVLVMEDEHKVVIYSNDVMVLLDERV